MASHAIRGIDIGYPERRQLGDKRLGLRAALLVQRPYFVVTGKSGLAARGAVPDDQNRLGIRRLFGPPAQYLSVIRVRHLVDRGGDRQPDEVVDLMVGSETAADASGRPVLHLFGARL